MAVREVVKLNIPVVTSMIKKACRSNVVFCEKMGRHATWVSDWKRAVPKNLPSPEEAAQMCVILQVEPKDILVDAEDVAKVTALLDSHRKEKSPAVPGEADKDLDDLIRMWESASPEERKMLREIARTVLNR